MEVIGSMIFHGPRAHSFLIKAAGHRMELHHILCIKPFFFSVGKKSIKHAEQGAMIKQAAREVSSIPKACCRAERLQQTETNLLNSRQLCRPCRFFFLYFPRGDVIAGACRSAQ